MTTTPPPGGRSDARAARYAVLVTVLVVPVLVVLVLGVGALWQMSHPDGWGQQNRDAGDLTAWQSRGVTNQILRDTAAAGLDVQLWNPGIGESSCDRGNGKYDGTDYSLDGLTHEGPVDSAAVTAAVAAYWQHLGLRVVAPLTQDSTPSAQMSTQILSVSATTSTGAWIEVSSGPGATTFSGKSGCAAAGGGPTPLPSATLLPVSSGVPVPRSSTP